LQPELDPVYQVSYFSCQGRGTKGRERGWGSGNGAASPLLTSSRVCRSAVSSAAGSCILEVPDSLSWNCCGPSLAALPTPVSYDLQWHVAMRVCVLVWTNIRTAVSAVERSQSCCWLPQPGFSARAATLFNEVCAQHVLASTVL